jgi:FkbM family methyltransferase
MTTMLDDSMLDHLFACAKKDSYFFELIIRRVYEAVLSPGDTAVDGGACGGIHTFPMAKRVGPTGRVHAVEAHPAHAHELAKKVATKSLEQITMHAVALSNETGIGEFVCVKTHPSRSGLRKLDLSRLAVPVETETIQVNRVRLDDILPTNTVSWRFCKLDLEGGEYHALMGATSAIEKHKPFIVFENGRDVAAGPYGYTRDDWFALFDRLGYAIFDLFGRPFTPSSWRGGRHIPWYCMAVGRNSLHVDFITNTFPGLLKRVIDEYGEPSSRYATQNWWKLGELPALKPAT